MTVRDDALHALRSAVRAANPQALVREKIKLRNSRLFAGDTVFDLSRFDRIIVIGGGKAGLGMALGVERVLGNRITSGLVTIPDYIPVKTGPRRISLHQAAHPLPSGNAEVGVARMLRLVGMPNLRDLVICLLSGGASALMSVPVEGLSLRDKQQTVRRLLASGAEIGEVNTVRRHLSRVKGGRLAEKLYPATILSLILSDVPGNKLEDVASGPTLPDLSTYADARRILEKYRLWRGVPEQVRRIIERGIAGRIAETVKPSSRVFRRVRNVLVGDNGKACAMASRVLREKGYRTTVLTRTMTGEAKRVGSLLSGILREVSQGQFSLKRPMGLVAAGETTVEVKGEGKGGRNQELVLAAALGIQGLPRVTVASIGTDGFDGPTPAAGALADGSTVKRALAGKLKPQEFLEKNDSYNFFKNLGDLIFTGPTGTNVGDIAVALAK